MITSKEKSDIIDRAIELLKLEIKKNPPTINKKRLNDIYENSQAFMQHESDLDYEQKD